MFLDGKYSVGPLSWIRHWRQFRLAWVRTWLLEGWRIFFPKREKIDPECAICQCSSDDLHDGICVCGASLFHRDGGEVYWLPEQGSRVLPGVDFGPGLKVKECEVLVDGKSVKIA